jgi:hypothetical protein
LENGAHSGKEGTTPQIAGPTADVKPVSSQKIFNDEIGF